MSKYQVTNGDFVTLTDAGIGKIKEYNNNYDNETKPIGLEERDWNTWHMSSLWIGIIVSIATYQLTSGFIVSGMSWQQALFTVILGHTLVLIPAIMIGHFGAKFGISFPMMSRAIFGIKGSIIPAFIRSIGAIFWFGIQTWIGGQAINIIIGVFVPSWKGMGFPGMFISFIIFWVINIYIAQSGAKGVKILESYSAPALILLSLIVIVWSAYVADWSFARLLAEPAVRGGKGNFAKLFLPGLSAMIAFDGGPALSMPDFSRHMKSQRSQVLGQLIVAPITAGYIAFVGICGTAASSIAFGEAIWEPAILVSKFDNPIIVLIFSLFIIAAVLTTNVAGNLIPPSLAISTLFPKQLNYKKATYLAAILGLLTMPWYMMANPENFIFMFLGLLGALLGPVTGLFIASYWFEYNKEIEIVDLYRQDSGKYYFSNGWNKEMMIVFTIFTTIIIAGNFVPFLKFAYENSYLVGIITGIVYYYFVKGNKKNGNNPTAS